MPLIHGQLAGDEGGLFVVAIVEDFQQIALGLIGERRGIPLPSGLYP